MHKPHGYGELAKALVEFRARVSFVAIDLRRVLGVAEEKELCVCIHYGLELLETKLSQEVVMRFVVDEDRDRVHVSPVELELVEASLGILLLINIPAHAVLDVDPSAKLEVRLLGSRDTEELSFFRAAGGVGAALAAAPFASPCSFCLLAELGVGEGGTTTGLLLPSGLLAEAFAPNFPGVLMLLLLLLRLKKFAGVLGVKGVRGDPDPATDGMLLDGLPEAFNGILFSAASAAAHFLSSAAVMSTDLVRDEREDKETRLRRGLQSAEVGTEEKEARRESTVGVEEGTESDGNAPDKLCLIRGVLGADSLFVVVVVRVLVFTGGGSMDMIGAPSLRLPEEFPFPPFSESLDIWTPTSLPPSLLLLLQIASSSRRTATFPPEYDDLGAARGVVDPEVLLLLLLLLLPAVLFFNSDEEEVLSPRKVQE